MKQLIEEQKKHFDRLLPRSVDIISRVGSEFPLCSKQAIWNWHKQSLKQFIDGLIAREEGEIKEFQTQKDGEYHFGENQKTIGWNLAKEFTIAHLKELKEEIN